MENKEKTNESLKFFNKTKIISFSRLPYYLLGFLSTLLVGLTEIVQPNFDWSYFLTADYWYNVFLLNVANILISLAALFKKSEDLILEDKDGIIAKNNKALNDIAPEIQDKKVDIFIEETNRKIKKNVFIGRIKQKLFKLDNNVSVKNHNKYITYLKTNVVEEKEKIAKNSYIRKRIKYEKYTDDEWLDNNIDGIKVKKCPKLTRSFLTIGINSTYSSDFPTPKGIVIFRGLMPKFFLTFAITIVFYTFGLDFAKLGWISIITLSYKLICLVLNWIYGAKFADQYVKETVIDVLYMRIRWLVRFKEWREEKITLENLKEKEKELN